MRVAAAAMAQAPSHARTMSTSPCTAIATAGDGGRLLGARLPIPMSSPARPVTRTHGSAQDVSDARRRVPRTHLSSPVQHPSRHDWAPLQPNTSLPSVGQSNDGVTVVGGANVGNTCNVIPGLARDPDTSARRKTSAMRGGACPELIFHRRYSIPRDMTGPLTRPRSWSRGRAACSIRRSAWRRLAGCWCQGRIRPWRRQHAVRRNRPAG